jgi:hypothetical protein
MGRSITFNATILFDLSEETKTSLIQGSLYSVHHLLLRLGYDYSGTSGLVNSLPETGVEVSHELASSGANLEDDEAWGEEVTAEDIDDAVAVRENLLVVDNDSRLSRRGLLISHRSLLLISNRSLLLILHRSGLLILHRGTLLVTHSGWLLIANGSGLLIGHLGLLVAH